MKRIATGLWTAAVGLILFQAALAQAANPHVVGWVNTFVPGGGQFLLGDYTLGATQLVLEGTTFGYGYALSPRQPITLDGVPESLEVETGSSFITSSSKKICVQWQIIGGKLTCTKTQTLKTSSTSTVYSDLPIENRNAAYADILQEFGLKYHMVNVFNAYREAAGTSELGQGIDTRSTKDLFLDPFRIYNVVNPWVGIPLVLLAGFTIRDYFQIVHSGVTQLQPMNGISNQLLAFNYEIWQPFGSGAPEEMFYRGFVQNEAYTLVSSPWFSIPVSTLAFTFSHEAAGRPTAAIAGAYLGYLAHRNHGNLAPGISLHFWTVVMLGIETIALTSRAQGYVPLRYVTFGIDF